MSDLYFNRYAYPRRFIKEPIKADTFVNVVIPVYKEKDLATTLNSLVACENTAYSVEVILVVNHSEKDESEIKQLSTKTVQNIKEFVKENPSNLVFHIIEAFDLPAKKAGVGLARKIGMDEAAFRFNQIDQDGVILCFDADSLCQPNYLREIENHFLRNPKCSGTSIHFEHPLYLDDSTKNEAIILYELHLRYYIQALKYINYPFAFHTIGSSMAVRSSIYQKQGGMNQRKAGEDFYFLHKIIPLGNFQTISTTKVIPSSRISDRVPFGTGRAMQDYLSHSKDLKTSYDFQGFKLIKQFLEEINLQNLTTNVPQEIKEFLVETGLQSELEKIKSQSKEARHFKQRFFEWFNGFKMLKLVHYLRDHYFPEKPLVEEATQLLQENAITTENNLAAIDLLDIYRKLDKND